MSYLNFRHVFRNEGKIYCTDPRVRRTLTVGFDLPVIFTIHSTSVGHLNACRRAWTLFLANSLPLFSVGRGYSV